MIAGTRTIVSDTIADQLFECRKTHRWLPKRHYLVDRVVSGLDMIAMGRFAGLFLVECRTKNRSIIPFCGSIFFQDTEPVPLMR